MGEGARRVGQQLAAAMVEQDLTVDELARRVGKPVDHIQAVLDGYPNSVKRPTVLDTVDEIAASLGLSLNVT